MDSNTQALPCPDASLQTLFCERKARGWHLKRKTAPHRGEGTATVEPIRSRSEIDSIKHMLADTPRDLALFVCGIHFGLRGSDLLSLRWSDVMSNAGPLFDEIRVREQKTRKLRIIPIQHNPREALKALHGRTQPKPSDPVFASHKGKPLTIQRLHQLVRQWTATAGAKGNFGTHSLRKTCGYHLRMAGVGIEVIMKIFGHTSQEVTMRYIGINQDEAREARLKLDL